MTVRELLSHFGNDRTWVDICTPLFRKTGTIQSVVRENESTLLDSKVDSWRVTLTGVLEVNV